MVDRKHSYKKQVTLLIAAAFFGLLAYPFTRTTAAPYFNEAFGPENLTWAMIAAALLAVIVVIVYNRLARRFPLIPLCMAAILFIILVTTVFGFIMGHHPKWMALLFYAWSDVYILIIVEQFWSISNTLFDKVTAKKYYGVFLLSGSLGSLAGNALVTILAGPLGANNLLYLSSASLVIFILLLFALYKSVEGNRLLAGKFKIEHDIADHSKFGGASLVFGSYYLTLIALIIVATQIYINGSYFIFNKYIDNVSHEVALQSVLYGKTFFVVQIVTIFSSLVLTPLSLRYLGVGKTHYSIVLTIALIFLATVLSPQIALVTVLFIVGKSFDYSIFRAAKEMFYLPLHIAEKFQAKSFIDVFGYRFSKALAALSLIFVEKILRLSPFYLVGFGIVMWLVLIILILRIYNRMKT